MKKVLISICFVFGYIVNAIYLRSVEAESLSAARLNTNPTLVQNGTDQSTAPQPNLAVNTSPAATSTQTESVSVVAKKTVTPARTPTPTPVPTPVPVVLAPQGKYRNGTYTGSVADASYGEVQVEVVITNGKLSDVKFLSYPNDRQHSVQVSNYALPILRREAITAQSENVDTVSGASYTSAAFIESLGGALSKATS